MYPLLVIFDIDSTLLVPDHYYTPDQVETGLYDKQLLKPFLEDPNYQVAIASFNHINLAMEDIISGPKLGRLILDIQCPGGNSNQRVEEGFIQAWLPTTPTEMVKNGKNTHINLIIESYIDKYGSKPPKVQLYDDCKHNVYLARKNGVDSLWVPQGLTSNNIKACIRLGNKALFWVPGFFMNREELAVFRKYMIEHGQMYYSLYLPPEQTLAKTLVNEFIQILATLNFAVQVVKLDWQKTKRHL